MKKLFVILALMVSVSLVAQKRDGVKSDIQRNSLCIMMFNDGSIDKADVIKASFEALPVPDKYNDHNTGKRVWDLADSIKVTEEDYTILNNSRASDATADGGAKKKSMFGGLMKGLAAGTTGGLVGGGSDKDEVAARALKIMIADNTAKSLVNRWFMDSTGQHHTADIIMDRGQYALTAEQLAKAEQESAISKQEMVTTVAEGLVKSTFVVFNSFDYLPKEEVLAQIQATMDAAASLGGGYAQLGAKAAGLALKASLGDGYFVKITSHLFKLKWTDTLQQELYEMWDNMEAYNNANYTIEYIGSDKAFTNTKASIFKSKPEEELIAMATANAMDQVLAKLEKKYDVFKSKAPLYIKQGEGPKGKDLYYAEIGMKEGLEKGDKYEVLERVIDKATKKEIYKKVGELKVSDKVWDNRHGAEEELALKGETQENKYTVFEGSLKNAYDGLLIRQIK